MRVRIFAVVLLALVLPGRAFASPQDAFGFGARSPGMAQTGVSFADDHEAVYLNPAALQSLGVPPQGSQPRAGSGA